MEKLISAEKAIRIASSRGLYSLGKGRRSGVADEIAEAIEKLPEADAVPREVYEQVCRERDAAIEDLRIVLQHGTNGEPLEECWWCKGDCKPTTECRNLSEWKWRGVKEKQNDI